MLAWRCGRTSLFTGSGIRYKRKRVAVRRPKGTTAVHKWAVVRQHVSGKHLMQLLAFEAASSELALSSALGQLVASTATAKYKWRPNQERLGSAAVAAEVPELEARRCERLHYAQPRVLVGPRTHRGGRCMLQWCTPLKKTERGSLPWFLSVFLA